MARLDPTIAKETPPLFWLQGFDGTNQHDDRRAIGDQECFWMENFAPLGAGNARTIYDAAAPLYVASGITVVYQYAYNIGSDFFEALFFSDGSAIQVDVSDGTTTVIAAASTFAVTPSLPNCAQWGASGIVIVTADANGYFAWDGTLYSPGGAAPAWLSGLLAPLTTTGDTNTSESLTSVASTSGWVVGMMISSSAGDIPASTLIDSFVANTSAVISAAATASNSGVTLTVQWMMPLGIAGTAVEVYQNRVWIVNGVNRLNSAPGNGADFSTADGGGTAASTDGFLRTQYVNLQQSNGFLYVFGDGSINVISNVQTTGSPATTTYSNQNVDPQTGLAWRDTLVAFGRALIFAAEDGVYALFGGAATKISDKIDRLFQNLDASALTPTACLVTIFSVNCYALLINTLDPTTNTQRNLVVLWNGAKWYIASQSRTPIMINYVDSTGAHVHEAWGNDGTNLFQMFASASSTLQKKIVTKLWPGRSQLIDKTSKDAYVETSDLSGTGVIINGTLDSDTNPSVPFSMTANINFINNSGGLITFTNSGGGVIQFVSSPSGIQATPANQAGNRLGLTLTSTSPDFVLIGLGETYDENSFKGR